MSSLSVQTLRSAIAAVRADLSSDKTEDSTSPGDQKDASDDQKLLAALDAVDKAIRDVSTSDGSNTAEPVTPRTLKEAAAGVRKTFAAGRAGSKSK